MPIVSAVSELIIAQLLYLQYKEPGKDIYMYINSTGTCQADGSVVGFETEATAIYDTMNYVGSDVSQALTQLLRRRRQRVCVCDGVMVFTSFHSFHHHSAVVVVQENYESNSSDIQQRERVECCL